MNRRAHFAGLSAGTFFSSASVSFGQGISVTPIQMLNAVNVIAAKGVLLQPFVTKEIRGADGKLIERRTAKENSSRYFHLKPRRRWQRCSSELPKAGPGGNARVEGYRVAGKTGTAQKAEKGKGYVDDKVATSIIGFLPADDPEISIIVVVDEPSGAPLSSRVTSPPFFKRLRAKLSRI